MHNVLLPGKRACTVKCQAECAETIASTHPIDYYRSCTDSTWPGVAQIVVCVTYGGAWGPTLSAACAAIIVCVTLCESEGSISY